MRLYRCWDYQAGTWACPQRIVCKAEVTPQGDNIRFVVTNLKRAQPSFIYKTAYCARGRMENFIKNHRPFSIPIAPLVTPSRPITSVSFSTAPLCPDARLGTNRVARHEVDERTVQYPAKSSLESRRRVCELKTRIKFHLPTAFPLKHLYGKILYNLATCVP